MWIESNFHIDGFALSLAFFEREAWGNSEMAYWFLSFAKASAVVQLSLVTIVLQSYNFLHANCLLIWFFWIQYMACQMNQMNVQNNNLLPLVRQSKSIIRTFQISRCIRWQITCNGHRLDHWYIIKRFGVTRTQANGGVLKPGKLSLEKKNRPKKEANTGFVRIFNPKFKTFPRLFPNQYRFRFSRLKYVEQQRP